MDKPQLRNILQIIGLDSSKMLLMEGKKKKEEKSERHEN